MSDGPRELRVPARFRIQRRLGAGAFGEVYEAYDQEHHGIVALKALRRAGPAALYSFKREFRTLTDLAHPNLVTLYDLISDQQQWFLSMELVRGTNFVDYVFARDDRPPEQPSTDSGPDDETMIAGPNLDSPDGEARSDHSSRPVRPREDRLRAGLCQLAEGVSFLHGHGILHRDIKPSNVLVTDTGRVVLLDFGLATEFAFDAGPQTLDLGGTPAYMSPEQAAGQVLTEASDWYSVGVMLYLTLTGQLPFTGSLLSMLQTKQEREPVPASALITGLPADLDSLCQALLSREPSRRPAGHEVLAGLRANAISVFRSPADAPSRDVPRLFVGRQQQLVALREALVDVRRGETVTVHIAGSSGMGKTALVNHFLRAVRETDPDVKVLAGRCYEREEVPYKALDALVDALATHVKTLSRSQAESLLPRGLSALARVFPVLQRIDAVAAAVVRLPRPDVQDSHELRRRASAALREMLGRLAERHPLILFIDDLQWGDVDSASLLRELLRPPDQPALLLIACYRSEEVATSPMLRAWLPAPSIQATPAVRTLEVGELPLVEAAALAQTLMGDDRASKARADVIARESGGSPFFIDQLVRSELPGGDRSLETVLRHRAMHLTESARNLLEITAIAGRPLDLALAGKAAGLESGDSDIVASLRANHFIRTRVMDQRREIEPYHDRIRQTIIASLSAEKLKQGHHRLALALEESAQADPEALNVHFQGAGDAGKAAHYAVVAADRATATLAFDRAARLYRLAIDLQPSDDPDRRGLWVKLGDALANGGRVIEAAQAYLTASDGAEPGVRSRLLGQAAEQLLIGGHLDEGFEVLHTVLATEGLTLAASPRRALLSILLRRPYVLWRGTRFRVRSEDEIPPDQLRRIDLCYSVVRSLGFTDSIRAIEFQMQHLLLALDAGEPQRIAYALTFEAMADGRRRRSRPRAERLLKTATELLERAPKRAARRNVRRWHDNIEMEWGTIHVTAGTLAYLAGRWQKAHDEFKLGEQIYRDACALPYQIVVCQVYGLSALLYAGGLVEYFRRVPECLLESLDRGNVYAEANLRLHNAALKCFNEDDPDGAVNELRLAMARWSPRGFHVERAIELRRRCDFALYRGDAAEAWKALRDQWSPLRRSFLLSVEAAFILTISTRARTSLGLAGETTQPRRARKGLLDAAERDARRILKKHAHWGAPLARLIQAGVAVDRGDVERSLALLVDAEEGFDNAGMALHAAVAKSRRGALLGGDEGGNLIAESNRWMSDQGLANPARMSAMIAPGRW